MGAGDVLGSAAVRFTHDGVRGVEDAIRRVETGLGSMGRLGVAGGVLAGVGGALAAIGAVGLAAGAAVTAGFGFAVAKGVALAAQLEQTTLAFEVMLGSADAAKQLLEDLAQFAAATPFELPGIEQSARQLIAYGFAAKDIIPILTNLGDIAAGVNAPLEMMAQIYGRVRTNGRLSMMEVNRLADMGVPIYTALAQVMSVTEAEVRKLVERGQIGFADFARAMATMTAEGGRFQGLMERQSQTALGLVSTLRDEVGLGLRDVGKAFMEAFQVQDLIRTTIDVVSELRQHVLAVADGMFKAFGPTVRSGMQWVRDNTGSIGLGMRLLGASIANVPDYFRLMGADAKTAFLTTWDEAYRFGHNVRVVWQWILTNWEDILVDIMHGAESVFGNLLTNAKNFGVAFALALQGQGWDFVWTPLLDGFQRTSTEIEGLWTTYRRKQTIDAEQEADKIRARIGKRFLDSFPGDGSAPADGQDPGEKNKEAADQMDAAATKIEQAFDKIAVTDLFDRLQAAIGKSGSEERQMRAAEKTADESEKTTKAAERTAKGVERAVEVLESQGFGDARFA